MASRKDGARKKSSRQSNGNRAVDLNRVFADGTAVDRALRARVVDAILEHKRLGLPIAEWSFEENRVVWTPADKIPGRGGKKQRSNRRRAS